MNTILELLSSLWDTICSALSGLFSTGASESTNLSDVGYTDTSDSLAQDQNPAPVEGGSGFPDLSGVVSALPSLLKVGIAGGVGYAAYKGASNVGGTVSNVTKSSWFPWVAGAGGLLGLYLIFKD